MNHFVTFVVLVLDRLITTIQMMVNQISLLNNSGERGLWGWPSFFMSSFFFSLVIKWSPSGLALRSALLFRTTKSIFFKFSDQVAQTSRLIGILAAKPFSKRS